MNTTVRFVLSLALALLTFFIGVGVVRAAEMIASLLSAPAYVELPENIGVSSSENFHALMPPGGEVTVGEGRVLSCYDPNILRVWKELKKDEVFKALLSRATGHMSCSAILLTTERDLNNDGKKEILATAKGPLLCGKADTCGFWVFEAGNAKLKTLLAVDGALSGMTLGEEVQRTRTRGYTDVVVALDMFTNQTNFRTYKFDGKQYVESSCSYEVMKWPRDGEGLWKLISCKEFDKETGYKTEAAFR